MESKQPSVIRKDLIRDYYIVYQSFADAT